MTIGMGFGKDWMGLFGRKTGQDGDEEWEIEGVNGEVLREGMETWRGRQIFRGCVWGLAWGMSMVGLWGDGV